MLWFNLILILLWIFLILQQVGCDGRIIYLVKVQALSTLTVLVRTTEVIILVLRGLKGEKQISISKEIKKKKRNMRCDENMYCLRDLGSDVSFILGSSFRFPSFLCMVMYGNECKTEGNKN